MERDPVLMAFEHFYHLDHANARIHLADVRFSPITFRLAELLSEEADASDSDVTAELAEVLRHKGTYPEDPGR